MASIDTLEEDLKMLGTSFVPTEDQLAGLGASIALKTARAMKERDAGSRPLNTLYASELGTKCARQLWYKVHKPELAEAMPHNALFKFLYGDMIEETILSMCKMAGHTVEREQELVEYQCNGWKIRGRIDAVIDGVLVDVKSCSPFAYKKFKEGLNDKNDTFGYREQIGVYKGILSNPAGVAQYPAFLAVDKLNGHIGLFEETSYSPENIAKVIDRAIEISSRAKTAATKLNAVPQSDTSPNMVLGTACSYCAFKKDCWSKSNGGTGLVAYNYSSGPVYFTELRKVPAPHIKRIY